MFHTVLIANRGAVAARVLRALRALRIRSVCVYSEADRDLPYLREADATFCIGEAPAQASYLNIEALIDVLRRSGADAVHPGYGFLAENAAFARRVAAEGAVFIGPAAEWIEAMGHKTRAREVMARHGLAPGLASAVLPNDDAAVAAAADRLGYPVMVKPANGGGGIGMRAAHDAAGLQAAVTRSRALAERSFGNGDVYLERLIENPRHVEFQMLGDRHGHVRHLYERDCSVQRRHQKVIEESPAPNLPAAWVTSAAQRYADVLAQAGYDVIGTVETLNAGGPEFHFLEMNTRLQVEHAVTEAITGIDLVQSQIRLAAGARLDDVLPAVIPRSGHAIEARIYAEDPVRFIPSPGLLRTLRFPEQAGLRVETGYAAGCVVTPHYDPMIAKLVVHAPDRDAAIGALDAALAATVIEGVKTNISFVRQVLAHEAFRRGNVHTGLAAQVLRDAKAAA